MMAEETKEWISNTISIYVMLSLELIKNGQMTLKSACEPTKLTEFGVTLHPLAGEAIDRHLDCRG